ncbi:MAG: tryptophan--tRNA ligase [Candidatus Omnitrophota bacterium]
MNQSKKIVLSGMRPTGCLHLGHLVGAINNWVKLQEEYSCFFMVADWHALMSEYENPSNIKNYIFDNVATWIACGIDPDKSVIFVQSGVKEHLYLNMFLSCLTPLGWLERCPTYKEQLREIKDRDIQTYAFLGYPVLQAADILLYRANFVPVGQDQIPHLELTREIARRFNNLYKETFPEPEAFLSKVPKLLGLDGRKMSKSYGNTINFSDSKDEFMAKMQKMFTDPKRIKLADSGHPKECNVFSYISVFLPERTKELQPLCENAKIGCTECKKKLSELLYNKLEPIFVKRQSILKDKKTLKDILEEGKKRASETAGQTLSDAMKAVSLVYE